ncbi:MAG: hypothetical protein ACJATP_003896, partial [Candidatus Azotimanducaceae bacterium]
PLQLSRYLCHVRHGAGVPAGELRLITFFEYSRFLQEHAHRNKEDVKES